MEKTKQLIILGGGASIIEGMNLGLFSKIKGKFIMGLNFAEMVLKTYYNLDIVTFTTYVDIGKFYNRYNKELKSLKLVVGRDDNEIKTRLNNTIFLPNSPDHYYRDLSKGVYKNALAGLFGLSLGIYLLDVGQIFLLGMDMGGQPPKGTETSITYNRGELALLEPISIEQFNKLHKEARRYVIRKKDKLYIPKSHWYQDKFTHRGTGKIHHYYSSIGNINNKIEKKIAFFLPYKNEKKVKIYNVSPYSRIPENIFQKISYKQMFKLLDKEIYNQNELRKTVRIKLNDILCKKTNKKV